MKTSKLSTDSKKLSANAVQIGGDHYKKYPLEHWDMVLLFNLDYLLGLATKYMLRWEDKGGILDLEKAVHVIQKKIEIEKMRAEGTLTIEIIRRVLAKLEMEKLHTGQKVSSATLPASTRRPYAR